MTERPLWTPRPQDVAASGINAFMAEVNRRHRLALSSYRDLHAWSDSAAYLTRRNEQIVVTLEHRSAQAPPPLTPIS